MFNYISFTEIHNHQLIILVTTIIVFVITITTFVSNVLNYKVKSFKFIIFFGIIIFGVISFINETNKTLVNKFKDSQNKNTENLNTIIEQIKLNDALKMELLYSLGEIYHKKGELVSAKETFGEVLKKDLMPDNNSLILCSKVKVLTILREELLKSKEKVKINSNIENEILEIKNILKGKQTFNLELFHKSFFEIYFTHGILNYKKYINNSSNKRVIYFENAHNYLSKSLTFLELLENDLNIQYFNAISKIYLYSYLSKILYIKKQRIAKEYKNQAINQYKKLQQSKNELKLSHYEESLIFDPTAFLD